MPQGKIQILLQFSLNYKILFLDLPEKINELPSKPFDIECGWVKVTANDEYGEGFRCRFCSKWFKKLFLASAHNAINILGECQSVIEMFIYLYPSLIFFFVI